MKIFYKKLRDKVKKPSFEKKNNQRMETQMNLDRLQGKKEVGENVNKTPSL